MCQGKRESWAFRKKKKVNHWKNNQSVLYTFRNRLMSETKTKRVSLGFHLESKMWVGLDFSKNMDDKS